MGKEEKEEEESVFQAKEITSEKWPSDETMKDRVPGTQWIWDSMMLTYLVSNEMPFSLQKQIHTPSEVQTVSFKIPCSYPL